MRAKHQRRSDETEEQRRTDEEIIDDMLEVIKPPPVPGKYLERKAGLKRCIRHLRYFATARRAPSPAQGKEQLADYLKSLRAAKRSLDRLRWHPLASSPFGEDLGAQILRIKRAHDDFKVPPGSKQKNRVADAAMRIAAWHLGKGRFKLTEEGAWHRLTTLFFEAATGEQNRFKLVWGYMRKVPLDQLKEMVRQKLLVGDYDY